MVEFIKAMREAAESNTHDYLLDDGENDDEDDAVLEAMLEAQERGYGEFEDDFDEQEEGSSRHFVDEDDEDEDDDPAVSFFGKRPHDERDEDKVAKKMKAKEAS
jgi:hypothetical protein